MAVSVCTLDQFNPSPRNPHSSPRLPPLPDMMGSKKTPSGAPGAPRRHTASSYSGGSAIHSRLPLGAIQKSPTKTNGHFSRSPKSSAALDYKSSSLGLGGAGSKLDYKRTSAVLAGVPGLDKSFVSSPRYPRDGLPPVKPSPRVGKDGSSRKEALKNGHDTGSGGQSPDIANPKKGESESPRKALPPPALKLDFIKAALSNNKQVFSNQEIRQKAANWTSDKQTSQGSKRTNKSKSNTTHSSGAVKSDSELSKETNAEEKDAKILEIFSNEGFAPKGKSNELGAQLKALRRRLEPETLVEEEEEEKPQGTSPASFSFL